MILPENISASFFFLLGTKELVVSVDDDGVISLNFECDQMTPNSEFIWSKDYVPTEDSPRLEVESKGNKYGLFQSNHGFPFYDRRMM